MYSHPDALLNSRRLVTIEQFLDARQQQESAARKKRLDRLMTLALYGINLTVWGHLSMLVLKAAVHR